MKSDGAMRLGPVARKLINPDKWVDGYPGPPAYVRELDALLHFAKQLDGCWERFQSRIEARDRERDKTLNELRLAYLFASLGFSVGGWDPLGANGKKGEFMLSRPQEASVFIELKSRGWESELTPAQKKAELAKRPKHEVWKGGAVDNTEAVVQCISARNCYPKFLSNQPNLLIISDDLRVPLHSTLSHVKVALYGRGNLHPQGGCFSDDRFENLGGLAVFNASSSWPSRGMEYEFIVFPNPKALPATALPGSMLLYTEKLHCVVRGTDPRQDVIYL